MSPALATQLSAAFMYDLVEEPGDGRHAVVRDSADPGMLGYGDTIEEAAAMLAVGRRLKQRMILQQAYLVHPVFLDATPSSQGLLLESSTSHWEIETTLNEALSA